MVTQHSNATPDSIQGQGGLDYIRIILECIDMEPIIEVLSQYRKTGRKGYPLHSLLRAHLAGRILDIPSVSRLVRRLDESAELRLICGLNQIPHRTTLARFFYRLAEHTDVVDACLATLTNRIAADPNMTGFGERVAVDSTVVPTHGNPNRRKKRPADADAECTEEFDRRDAEATWTKKNSARAYTSDGKEAFYGYKYHLLCDATHGIPMVGYLTTAKRNDSPTLPTLMELTSETHEWFAPEYVIADRGYDSEANHKTVMRYGAKPVIHIRDQKKGRKKLRDRIYHDIYTINGVPTCNGMREMEYVRSDPQKGHLYRCRPEACHPDGGNKTPTCPTQGCTTEDCRLKNRKGVVPCRDEYWVSPEEQRKHPRITGPVRRESDEWRDSYALRQGIERCFKSMKQSRALDRHCWMGSEKIGLHVALCVLAYQATVLARLLAGDLKYLRWMVLRVA